MTKDKYVYFTGDFFISENDDVNIFPIIQKCFDSDPVIFNIEGVPAAPMNTMGNIRRKAVPLTLNQSVLKLRDLKNCYFSLVNNHSSDNGQEAYRQFIERLGDNALYSNASDADPRRKVGDVHIIFFADEREECRCKEYGYLRFDQSIILKNKDLIKGSYVVIHGGIEYRRHPTPYQRYLSHLLINLGAQAVLFHHSHVGGSHEWLNDKLIHYGLGNFYFSSVHDLHGHDVVDGKVLRICSATGNYEVSDVKFIKSPTSRALHLDLKFSLLSDSFDFQSLPHYRKWYRDKYPLDSSLRPRQLFYSERIIRIQFIIWYNFASFLMRAGLTKKVKLLLRKLLK